MRHEDVCRRATTPVEDHYVMITAARPDTITTCASKFRNKTELVIDHMKTIWHSKHSFLTMRQRVKLGLNNT